MNFFRKRWSLAFYLLILQFMSQNGSAQPGYWQQRVKYTMDIDVNVVNNRFNGKQQLDYTNHSPDTLKRVFYHLFWNAFQPNSMMDNRSREMGKVLIHDAPDWDPRVTDRIQQLSPEEIGYQKIISLKMNGVVQPFEVAILAGVATWEREILLERQREASGVLATHKIGQHFPRMRAESFPTPAPSGWVLNCARRWTLGLVPARAIAALPNVSTGGTV